MTRLEFNECTGFTKEEAFKELNYNPDRPSVKGCNCTQMWHKEGSPIPGTLAFKRFAIEQLMNKTRNEEGVGLYIVLDPPIPDNRKRPYSIVNYKATDIRHWKFVYQIREDDLDISEIEDQLEDAYGDKEITLNSVIHVTKSGMIVDQCDSKAEALESAKNLTSKTKKSYSILAVKVPDLAPIAAQCVYTPSKGAKKGTWYTWGYTNNYEEKL